MLAAADLPGKEVSDCGKVLGGCRCTCLPSSGDPGERRIRRCVLHTQQPYLRKVSVGDLLRGVGHVGLLAEAAQRHLHVRLPGGKPYIPHQQVRARQFIAAAHRERERAARRFGHEPRLPQSQPVCGGGERLRMKRNRDLLLRRSLAPNMNGHVALENSMVGDHGGESNLRPGWGETQAKESED